MFSCLTQIDSCFIFILNMCVKSHANTYRISIVFQRITRKTENREKSDHTWMAKKQINVFALKSLVRKFDSLFMFSFDADRNSIKSLRRWVQYRCHQMKWFHSSHWQWWEMWTKDDRNKSSNSNRTRWSFNSWRNNNQEKKIARYWNGQCETLFHWSFFF